MISFWCRFGIPYDSRGAPLHFSHRPLVGSKTISWGQGGRLGVVLSFGIAFLVVLGSSWGRFRALRESFWCFFGISTHRFNPSTHQLIDLTHQLINPSIQLVNPSTHRFTHQPIDSSIQPIDSSIQLINSSTHGPSALSYPARRTARRAIK